MDKQAYTHIQRLYCFMLVDRNQLDRWLPHLLGLVLFIILPILVFDSANDRSIYWTYNYYYQLVFMVVAFYTNFLILVTQQLQQGHGQSNTNRKQLQKQK